MYGAFLTPSFKATLQRLLFKAKLQRNQKSFGKKEKKNKKKKRIKVGVDYNEVWQQKTAQAAAAVNKHLMEEHSKPQPTPILLNTSSTEFL